MSGSPSFRHEIVGCMSQGAAGNPSGVMVEAGFAQLRMPWRYINLEVAPDDLGAAVRGAWAMGFRGFNLSMPHKVSVIPFLGGLGESARLIGAVNCVVRRDNAFIGENTDGKGFLASLKEAIDPRGKDVVIFGAGGASRAIAFELALAGVRRLTVVNRNRERGADLAGALRKTTRTEISFVAWSGEFVLPAGSDVVINATSIGLYDAEARLPVDVGSLHNGMVVADVVFNPPRTRFLRDAEARGCTVLDGLGMLVNQGVIGVSYWTGAEPNAAVMRGALTQAMGL